MRDASNPTLELVVATFRVNSHNWESNTFLHYNYQHTSFGAKWATTRFRHLQNQSVTSYYKLLRSLSLLQKDVRRTQRNPLIMTNNDCKYQVLVCTTISRQTNSSTKIITREDITQKDRVGMMEFCSVKDVKSSFHIMNYRQEAIPQQCIFIMFPFVSLVFQGTGIVYDDVLREDCRK